MNLSDILKLNEDELPVVSGFLGLSGNPEMQLDQILRHFNLKYVVYTLGSKGSIIISDKERSFAEVPNVKIADTVGAGDSFTAVFIAGILKGVSLKEIHNNSNGNRSLCLHTKGRNTKT